jgi:uncharacterized membrane protein YbhN (UPF0104 family)
VIGVLYNGKRGGEYRVNKKIKFQLIVGLIITAAVIVFSVIALNELKMRVDLPPNINWLFVILAVLIYIYSNVIRGYAFSRGIDPEMDDMTALEVVGIGHALNMVLPLHAGEGLRLAFFPKNYSMAKRSKLCVITILSDTIVVIIIAALTVPFVGITDKTMLRWMWILLYACIGLLALMAALIAFVPRVKKYVKEFLGIALLKMTVWVALSWLILVAAFWLGLIACGFKTVESIEMAFALFVTTSIINLIPASPGGIGLFESGTIIGLGGFGVNSQAALQVSILLHLIQYMALLPLGVFLYIKAMHGKYGDAIRSIWKKGEKV